MRSDINWPRALKKRRETRAVCTGFLQNTEHLSSFYNLLKKLCEFHSHVWLIFWRVTSRWGSVLKMEPSVSSEMLIGVELYNIPSPKTTTIFHFHRHEHLRSPPQYVFFSWCRRSVVLLTRRGGRRRFYPCNSAKVLEEYEYEAHIKWPHKAVFPFICSEQPSQLSYVSCVFLPFISPFPTPFSLRRCSIFLTCFLTQNTFC